MINLETILKIGKVISVKGRQVDVLVDKTKNTSHLVFNGELIKNVSVGSYVKIHKGFQFIIGKIDGEYISEDKSYESKEYKREQEKIKRVLNVSLLGYFESSVFKQGIKELPLIDNECSLLTQDEFEKVHNFIKEIDGKLDEGIVIGRLANEKSQEIKVGVNSLFASHIGIFGNTGSGKSYTLASLYHRLFKKYGNNNGFNDNAKFLLIDFNGEYSGKKCITEDKKVYNLSTRKSIEEISDDEKLPISEDALIDVEIISILANATEKTQKPFISRAIRFYKKVNSAENPIEYFKNTIKKRFKSVMMMADKEKAFDLVDYLVVIIDNNNEIESIFENSVEWNNTRHHFMPKGGDSRQLTNVEIEDIELYKEIDNYIFNDDIITRLIHFLYLQIILDVYTNKAKNDHISPAINKLKSKTNSLRKVINTEVEDGRDIFSDKSIVVVSLNEVNIDIKKTIPLLLTKKTYDDHKVEYRKDERKFLNIIIDEAHNILSYNSQRESETWKDYRLETFEEIIKEGRKFGVFLTVASQRPSDISSTIISQLHNYFLHRLINNRDIEAVERTISYLDKVSVEALSIMPTGTCVLAGLSAQVPVIINIDEIEEGFEPHNKTIRPTDFWRQYENEDDQEEVQQPNQVKTEVEEDDDLPF